MEKIELSKLSSEGNGDKAIEDAEAMIPYEELEDTVKALELAEYKPFKFNGQMHQLIFCQEESGDPIEFHASTQLDGCDIYICPSIMNKGKDFLRVILAHELAEIAAYDLILKKSDGDRLSAIKQGHELALKYEKKFAESQLDKENLGEYEGFCRDLRSHDKEEGEDDF